MVIYRTLKLDELLNREDDAAANAEIIRRLRTEELLSDRLDEIKDYHYGKGLDDATPDAIDFIYNLMDGEVWREQLDDDTREWIKTDLLMLLDTTLTENNELDHTYR